MPIRTLVAFTVASIAVFSLGACGDGRQSAMGEEIRIVGTEMAFSPQAVTTTRGRHRVIFANEGRSYHELAVVSPRGTILGARSIPAGETAVFDVELDEPGGYRLLCREPGHTQAGIVGELTVNG